LVHFGGHEATRGTMVANVEGIVRGAGPLHQNRSKKKRRSVGSGASDHHSRRQEWDKDTKEKVVGKS